MVDVLEQLSTLPPEKLREAAARIQFLQNPTGAAPTVAVGTSDDAEMVAKVLSQLLGRFVPVSVLNTATRGRFMVGVNTMMEFIRKELRPGRARVQTVRAIKLLCGMIVKDLRKRRIPVTPRTVAHGMTEVAMVVDRHLPGYGPAGLLKLVLLPGRSSE